MGKRTPLKLTSQSKSASDSSKLMYNELMGPALGAINDMQQRMGALQQFVVQRMATVDGVDTAEGWQLDITTMRWIKKEG